MRHRFGTILDLARSSESPDGKILNALDLPLPLSEDGPLDTITSDLFAYITNQTADHNFPCSSTCWVLAATKGALTGFHIDTDGMVTYIQCVSNEGCKWWIVATPRSDAGESEAFLDFQSLFDVYNLVDVSEMLSKVKLEAIYLTKGTRL